MKSPGADSAAKRRERENTAVRFAVPIPPSVNHAFVNGYGGSRVLSKAAKEWAETAADLAFIAARESGWRESSGEKLVMELRAFWPDRRRRDIHNLHKLIADAFEGVLYEDDMLLLIRDMDFAMDRKRPRVEIEVRAL